MPRPARLCSLLLFFAAALAGPAAVSGCGGVQEGEVPPGDPATDPELRPNTVPDPDPTTIESV